MWLYGYVAKPGYVANWLSGPFTNELTRDRSGLAPGHTPCKEHAAVDMVAMSNMFWKSLRLNEEFVCWGALDGSLSMMDDGCP